MDLRPYQSQVVEAVERGWGEFSKQLAVVPTGGGKTIIFSRLAQRRLPGRTLILAHREELIDQAIAKLYSATGIRADKEKADSYASLSAPVVVGSIQSLMRPNRRERWPRDHFAQVVVDEAHHVMASSYMGVLQHFDAVADVLGVTATPDRGDKKNLGEYFENVAAEISLFDLIDDGYLSPITIKTEPLKIDLSAVRQTDGDFNDADLGNAIEPYLGEIARLIKRDAGNRRTLAFLPLIATSQKFVTACREAGLTAAHVDGESPDRKEILRRFADWEFDVLSNAMLLTEGFDDPSIDCVVILRPTKSRPLYAQMVGRGTRTDALKENLLLLDFLWMHSRHSVTRPAHLIAKSEDEAEAITQMAVQATGMPAEVAELLSMDLQELAGRATLQREESLRKRLEEQKHKKGKFISAEEFAMQHNDLDAAEFEPVFKWQKHPVTEGQAKHLKRAGIDPATVRGSCHASQLLNIYFKNQRLELATEGQQRLLSRLGYENPDKITKREAGRIIAQLRSR